MKLILSGATGFVGSIVLRHLVADPRVTEITCISRRAIDAFSPKLRVILQEDFLTYDVDKIGRLAAHDGCIWTLGGKASDIGGADAFARVTHGFTLALAAGIAERAERPFTFCYLSGMGADPTESIRLPWERLTRHLKGRTERDLHTLQARHPAFCAHAFRPGGILPDETNSLLRLTLAPIVVSGGQLADALIEGCLDSRLFRRAPVISNSAIKKLARKQLPHDDAR
jgi:hypothetical protein